MYFAVLGPVVAFGQLTAVLTGGILGVPHFIISASLCGVAYGTLAGQPMTMIGPTGLTFAYVAALHRLCVSNDWPFLGLYSWTGLWCSAVLALLSVAGTCSLVRLVTRFTDDIFNGLIVITFLATACQSIASPFALAAADKTLPFIDATIALGTFGTAWLCGGARSLPYLWHGARAFLADFGPVLAIAAATLVARSPQVAGLASVGGLSVPSTFSLGRPLFVPLWPGTGVPPWVPLAALPPALLLSLLFFLDQNITSRVVSNPTNGLRKGATYHLDLLVLAGLVCVCSLMGLPWMVAATVQSLSHVRAMARGDEEATAGGEPGGGGDQPTGGVIETRLTGVIVHAIVGASFVILPLLQHVPASAISGLFLFLGVRMMGGNAMLSRVRLLFYDPACYPSEELRGVRPVVAHAFTALQLACLFLLWRLRAAPSTALLFPSVIILLVWVRLYIVPKAFSPQAILALDEPIHEAPSGKLD